MLDKGRISKMWEKIKSIFRTVIFVTLFLLLYGAFIALICGLIAYSY